MTRKNKLRYMAVLIACILIFPFAGVIAHAESTGAKEQKKTQDEVQLTEKNGKIEVSLGMDHAHKEQLTAVSLTLRIDVKNGKEKVSFSFPKELQDAVTGSRYKDGYLYLYASNDSGIFDKNDKLVLGNLKVEADNAEKGVNAVVCYVEDSLKTVNAAYGDRVVKDAAYSTAITVDKAAKKDQNAGGTDPSDDVADPGQDGSDENGKLDSNGSKKDEDGTADKGSSDDKSEEDQKKEGSSENTLSEEEESLKDGAAEENGIGENSSDEEKDLSSTKLEDETNDRIVYIIIAAVAIIILTAGIILWRKKKADKSE